MSTESVLIIMVLTIISAGVAASQDENGSQLKKMAERQKLESEYLCTKILKDNISKGLNCSV